MPKRSTFGSLRLAVAMRFAGGRSAATFSPHLNSVHLSEVRGRARDIDPHFDRRTAIADFPLPIEIK